MESDPNYQSPIDWTLLTYIETGLVLVLYMVVVALMMQGAFAIETYETMEPLIRLMPDLNTCIFGTAFLLLTAMTLDCMVSNSIRSKPIIRCFRTFMPFLAFILGIVIFLIVLIAKFNILFEGVFEISPVITIILVNGLYLLTFVLLPAMFIMIFGTINWVSDLNSSRFLKEPKQKTRKLDHQICVLSIFVILLFLVAMIIKFSHELQVYQSKEVSEITRLVHYALTLTVDLAFVLYPVLFMCQLGGYCCCLEEHN
eukprot:maker-scaffold590_size129399-snap-gene-0.29 protein:Tk08097 transcript:maker-scaffold590_size129399-snap-gene-0.29-mRNA-1 annotation:"amino acid permease"